MILTWIAFLSLNLFNLTDYAKIEPLSKSSVYKQDSQSFEVCFAGGRADATISIADAKKGSGLGCIYGGGESPNCVVLSFKMTVTIAGNSKTLASESNSMTEEQKNLKAKVKPGSKIVFSDVKVKMPDGKIKMVGPATFSIN